MGLLGNYLRAEREAPRNNIGTGGRRCIKKADAGKEEEMQEEVNQKVVSLCIRTSRMSGDVLAKAMRMYLDQQRRKPDEPAHGKQTFKQLMEQNAGATSIEVDAGNIRDFDRVARKFHIDYAVRRDKASDPPKYFVFFKARDQDAMTMAFKEFVSRNAKKSMRPSFRKTLKKFMEMGRDPAKHREREKTKQKDRGQSL